MENKLKQIAQRLKEIREICGFSKETVAAKLSMSTEAFNVYEESGNFPISALYDLAVIYGVDPTELLTGKSPKLSTYSVMKKGAAIGVDRYPGYHFKSLAYNFKRRIMEPLMVNVEPENKETALVTHNGQEFNYVISGSIMVILGDEQVILNEGDCIYFDPTIPHGQKAMNNKPAQFLTVIAE